MSRSTSGVWSAPASGWNPAVAGASVKSADWNALLTDLTTAVNQMYPPQFMAGSAISVNLNSIADTQIAMSFTPASAWVMSTIMIVNVGTTASLNTAQFGLFSAAGGAGTAIQAGGTSMAGIVSNAASTAGAVLLTTPTLSTAFFTLSTVYFRVTTPQGASATGHVYLFVRPITI